MDEDLIYLNALNQMSFLGPVRINALLGHFGSARAAWEASGNDLGKLPEFKTILERFLQETKDINPENEWNRLKVLGISLLSPDSPSYPPLLKEICQPPPLLYCLGQLALGDFPPLAVVGSRRCTFYGKEVAARLAGELAASGFSIISGLAMGVDTAAHRGALELRGKTVAVLGCSLETCYPSSNTKLMQDILENGGAVISEFPLGTKPLPHHFPQRNRIISGISLGTLVVEATEKSGALITAHYALEQNREVFAVPGNVGSPYSKGCHLLIKEGARLVEAARDILEEISFREIPPVSPAAPASFSELSSEEKKLLELLPYQPMHLDELIRLSGFRPEEANTLLLSLELKGLVRQLPGKYFCRQ